MIDAKKSVQNLEPSGSSTIYKEQSDSAPSRPRFLSLSATDIIEYFVCILCVATFGINMSCMPLKPHRVLALVTVGIFSAFKLFEIIYTKYSHRRMPLLNVFINVFFVCMFIFTALLELILLEETKYRARSCASISLMLACATALLIVCMLSLPTIIKEAVEIKCVSKVCAIVGKSLLACSSVISLSVDAICSEHRSHFVYFAWTFGFVESTTTAAIMGTHPSLSATTITIALDLITSCVLIAAAVVTEYVHSTSLASAFAFVTTGLGFVVTFFSVSCYRSRLRRHNRLKVLECSSLSEIHLISKPAGATMRVLNVLMGSSAIAIEVVSIQRQGTKVNAVEIFMFSAVGAIVLYSFPSILMLFNGLKYGLALCILDLGSVLLLACTGGLATTSILVLAPTTNIFIWIMLCSTSTFTMIESYHYFTYRTHS